MLVAKTFLPTLLFLLLIIHVVIKVHWHVPEPRDSTIPKGEFSEGRSREFLNKLNDIGYKTVGSEANEVKAVHLIMETMQSIYSTSPNSQKFIFDISNSPNYSGHYHLDFIGGLNAIYSGVTNIAVRLSTPANKHLPAILLGSHFDSAHGSTGGADAGACISILVEIFRNLLHTEPEKLAYPVIFNFNGAEESILMASHGFATQHPWVAPYDPPHLSLTPQSTSRLYSPQKGVDKNRFLNPKVRVVINLEAAGSGGRDMLFQSGRSAHWILDAYSKGAKYPLGHSIGQDVFEHSLVPGETDYRMYTNFSAISGIDMAWTSYGHLYHTMRDIPANIPPGSIQRYGENVLGFVQEIFKSPAYLNEVYEAKAKEAIEHKEFVRLEDLGSEDNQRKVFFDVLGLFFVTCDYKMALLLLGATIIMWYWSMKRELIPMTTESLGFSLFVVTAGIFYPVLFSLIYSVFLWIIDMDLLYFNDQYGFFVLIVLFVAPSLFAASYFHKKLAAYAYQVEKKKSSALQKRDSAIVRSPTLSPSPNKHMRGRSPTPQPLRGDNKVNRRSESVARETREPSVTHSSIAPESLYSLIPHYNICLGNGFIGFLLALGVVFAAFNLSSFFIPTVIAFCLTSTRLLNNIIIKNATSPRGYFFRNNVKMHRTLFFYASHVVHVSGLFLPIILLVSGAMLLLDTFSSIAGRMGQLTMTADLIIGAFSSFSIATTATLFLYGLTFFLDPEFQGPGWMMTHEERKEARRRRREGTLNEKIVKMYNFIGNACYYKMIAIFLILAGVRWNLGREGVNSAFRYGQLHPKRVHFLHTERSLWFGDYMVKADSGVVVTSLDPRVDDIRFSFKEEKQEGKAKFVADHKFSAPSTLDFVGSSPLLTSYGYSLVPQNWKTAETSLKKAIEMAQGPEASSHEHVRVERHPCSASPACYFEWPWWVSIMPVRSIIDYYKDNESTKLFHDYSKVVRRDHSFLPQQRFHPHLDSLIKIQAASKSEAEEWGDSYYKSHELEKALKDLPPLIKNSAQFPPVKTDFFVSYNAVTDTSRVEIRVRGGRLISIGLPQEGLKDWSISTNLPSPRRDCNCHWLWYSAGQGRAGLDFWIEYEGRRGGIMSVTHHWYNAETHKMTTMVNQLDYWAIPVTSVNNIQTIVFPSP